MSAHDQTAAAARTSGARTRVAGDPRYFHVALLADAATVERFSRLLSLPAQQEILPRVRVAVLLQHQDFQLDEGALHLVPENWGGDPPVLCDSLHEALRLRPDVNLLLVFVDSPETMVEMRAAAPGTLSVLEREASTFLLQMLEGREASLACETDLHYTRTLFQTIFEEVEEDIILLDVHGKIAEMNKRVHERKGLKRQQIQGLYCWELEGEDFCCEHRQGICPFRSTLQTGSKAEQVHSFVDNSGRMRYFRVYTYPVFDQERRLTHVLEIRRDITSRTNIELRLQQAEKMAAIGELATYIAHEIRNPLFAIGGFANSLLRMPALEETAREKVSIILKESKRLDNILKSILNFARPTDPREGMVDINRVVAETAELMGFGARDKGINVIMELDRRMAMVKGDAELIKQCLINMIKNAVEAMPQGGALTLRTGLRGTFVTLEVADTGPGIPQELREKIFNPFFSTKEKGAGLGLPMTKKIIEEMGGRIELHTKVGQGTRFVLHLPPVLAVDDQDKPLEGIVS